MTTVFAPSIAVMKQPDVSTPMLPALIVISALLTLVMIIPDASSLTRIAAMAISAPLISAMTRAIANMRMCNAAIQIYVQPISATASPEPAFLIRSIARIIMPVRLITAKTVNVSIRLWFAFRMLTFARLKHAILFQAVFLYP